MEIQNNFLLSPPARALKPSEASRLSEDESYERFKAIRWGWTDGKPICPKCGHERIYEWSKRGERRGGRFECAKCGSEFSVTSKTTFASRKMGFRDLLSVIALRLHHRASPAVMAREVDIGYKALWTISKKLVLFGGGNVAIRTRERRWPFVDNEPKTPEGYDLIKRVSAVIPSEVPEQVRADVAQDMILGVLSGELTVEDLAKSVRKYISRHYTTYDNRFKHVSLSAPVPGTEDLYWGDIIPSQDPHEWDYITTAFKAIKNKKVANGKTA